MALIIRPNSGISNAMAGIAAGFGQGMQLGMEAEKLELARQRQAKELQLAEQRAALELAAEERAKTQFSQQQELFAQAQGERAASKEAMGYLAEAEGARTSLPNLPDQTGKFSYEFGTPQQSNQYTGMPINPVNAMLGKFANQAQYKGVLDNYNKQMTMAGKLASKMDPQTAQIFIKEKERQSLLMADESARQSFGSMIADMQGRGAFRILGPQGQMVDDPQMTATIQMLLEQSDNRNVPLAATQAQLQQVIEKVGANNIKARDFQFQSARIQSGIDNAFATNNEAGVKALQELQQFHSQNPFATPQQLSERFEAATSGRVPRQLPDGKTIYVSAVNADKELQDEVARYNELNTLRTKLATLEQQKAEAGIDLTKAQTEFTRNRNTGINEYQAQRLALSQWEALGEDGQFQVIEAGGTPQEWIAQQAAQLMSRGGMMPAGAGAGAAAGGMGAANTPFTGGGAARPMMNVPVNVQENIRRTLDEAGITDPKQRQIAAGQILRGEWGARKEAKVVPGETPPVTPPVTPPTAPQATDASLQASERALNLNESLSTLKPKGTKSIGEYRKELEGLDINKIASEEDADNVIERLRGIDKIYKVGLSNVIREIEDMKNRGAYPAESMTAAQLEAKRKKQYERGAAQGWESAKKMLENEEKEKRLAREEAARAQASEDAYAKYNASKAGSTKSVDPKVTTISEFAKMYNVSEQDVLKALQEARAKASK
jgi:hypothetical protein